jgi:hypothetical protein
MRRRRDHVLRQRSWPTAHAGANPRGDGAQRPKPSARRSGMISSISAPSSALDLQHSGQHRAGVRFQAAISGGAAFARLITRGGYDWTSRLPWIVEAALKNRHRQFVIGGEAVVLGVDGISDFKGLHSGKSNDEVQLYAASRSTVRTSAPCRCPCASKTSHSCSPAGRTASSWHPLSRADRSRPVSGRMQHGAGRHGVEAGRSRLSCRPLRSLDQRSRTRSTRRWHASKTRSHGGSTAFERASQLRSAWGGSRSAWVVGAGAAAGC